MLEVELAYQLLFILLELVQIEHLIVEHGLSLHLVTMRGALLLPLLDEKLGLFIVLIEHVSKHELRRVRLLGQIKLSNQKAGGCRIDDEGQQDDASREKHYLIFYL